MIFVVSGTYEEFLCFKRNKIEKGANPDSFTYVSNIDTIRGYKDCTMIRVGTWYNRDGIEIAELYDYGKAHNFTGLSSSPQEV
jgi:hypothetical protein